jgi:hypothetical protein
LTFSGLLKDEGNVKDSSVIEGGGDGDTGVTGNGVKSGNIVCLIDSVGRIGGVFDCG